VGVVEDRAHWDEGQGEGGSCRTGEGYGVSWSSLLKTCDDEGIDHERWSSTVTVIEIHSRAGDHKDILLTRPHALLRDKPSAVHTVVLRQLLAG
jgi:hypothetical protein